MRFLLAILIIVVLAEAAKVRPMVGAFLLFMFYQKPGEKPGKLGRAIGIIIITIIIKLFTRSLAKAVARASLRSLKSLVSPQKGSLKSLRNLVSRQKRSLARDPKDSVSMRMR